MSVKSRLIEIFKADIESILSHISDEENYLMQIFIKNEKFERRIYFIEFGIFEDFVNQYCFSIWKSNSIEWIIPDDRLSLFREIFLENMDFSTGRTIIYYKHRAIFSEESLYLLLFYHLFIQKIFTRNPINKAFEQALSVWKSSFATNKMPIELYLILPDTVFEAGRKTFQIAEDLELIRLFSYEYMTGSSRSRASLNSRSFNSILLKLTTSQSFDHNFYGDFRKAKHSMDMNEGEYQDILNRIRYFMLSFYLNGFYMMREDVETFTPWWIGEDLKKFKTSDIRFKDNKLELKDLNQLKYLFDKIVKLDLFKDEELELVLFNYNELHKKDLVSELILYDFIILESLFTRGSKAELSFRLSLNLALFVSESKEKFETIFRLSKKLYGIRSEIIHGGNWPNKLRKDKIPEQLGLDNNVKKDVLARAVHERLAKYINIAIRKVIQLKIDQVKINKSSDVMKNFKDLYFMLNSKVFQV